MILTKQQILIPNLYQLDELPFLKQDDLVLEQNLTAKRMLSLRNVTHKYQAVFAKIFAYWPIWIPKSNKQSTPLHKICVFSEMPILSLENFVYLVNQMQQKQQISKQQWNKIITVVQDFKEKIPKMMDTILITEHQIKISSKKNIVYYIYYSAIENCFRIKTSFKLLNFQVFSSCEKINLSMNFQDGFIIGSSHVGQKLKEKIIQKIQNYSAINFQYQKIQQIRNKFGEFYERDIKKIDENLLQLKLQDNFPILRQKIFLPIHFIDGLDNNKLMQPIIGNKNKYCMFGHFIGYNFNNFTKLENSSCRYCGLQIKQIQENVILMFLRSNIFNPFNRDILYCPQFNRFKIINKSFNELEILKTQVSRLEISQENNEGIGEDELSMNDKYQKNEEKKTITQITYTNYMHFCLTLKSFYPSTKSRLVIQPQKQIQYINYIYTIQHPHSQKNTLPNKYYKYFQLTDPARGKYCNHLQFVDLRLFYINRQKTNNIFVHDWKYTCPICQMEVKDSQIIYLKEALIIIKYIKKIIENADDMQEQSPEKEKVDTNSIRIIINNVQKKVFIEYVRLGMNGAKKSWDELEKLYHTLIDPYIAFSQYQLGIHKKGTKLSQLYDMQNNQQEIDNLRLEKQWFGNDKNQLII